MQSKRAVKFICSVVCAAISNFVCCSNVLFVHSAQVFSISVNEVTSSGNWNTHTHTHARAHIQTHKYWAGARSKNHSKGNLKSIKTADWTKTLVFQLGLWACSQLCSFCALVIKDFQWMPDCQILKDHNYLMINWSQLPWKILLVSISNAKNV